MSSESSTGELRARALAWLHAAIEGVCDVRWPWAHGTVLRATPYPTYYGYNVVRVEDDPGITVDQLTAFADEALAGLAHRRIDFDFAEAAEPLRAEFTARGWRSTRLVWMHHDGAVPPAAGPVPTIEDVPYDAVSDLHRAWHEEDFAGLESDYHAAMRAIDLRRGVRVFAVLDGGQPIAFTQLDRGPRGAEVARVYVARDRRGRGLGTALTRATILAAGGGGEGGHGGDDADTREDLWICADDEDRPKELYARLGFRAVGCSMEFTLWPPAASSAS
jgi:GNAT superfamily N-acetyltransferase